jgi:hypothetical protein
MSSPSLAEAVLEDLSILQDHLTSAIEKGRPLTSGEAAETLSAMRHLREVALARRLSSDYERARRTSSPAGSVNIPSARADG